MIPIIEQFTLPSGSVFTRYGLDIFCDHCGRQIDKDDPIAIWRDVTHFCDAEHERLFVAALATARGETQKG